jgi:ankyrin repeat protein
MKPMFRGNIAKMWCRSATWTVALLTLGCAGPSLRPTPEDLSEAAFAGNEVKVRLLLAQGVKVDAPSKRGCALDAAIAGNRASAVKLLLAAGADPNTMPRRRGAPLSLAIHYGNPEIVRMLLSAGAKVNYQKAREYFTALMEAINEDRIDIVRLLLDHGADPNKGADMMLPLQLAKSLPMIQLLVAYHANVKAKTRFWGDTPLFSQVQWHRSASVEYLLTHGADPNERFRKGQTPLMVAFFKDPDREPRRTVETLRVLLRHGADPYLRNNEGQDALAFARERSTDLSLLSMLSAK